MGRIKLDEGHSIPDPYYTHDWNVIFPSIPGNAGLDLRQLSLRAKTAEVPGITLEVDTITFKDVDVRFPKRQTWEGTIQVAFQEVRDLTTRQAFRNWALFYRNMRTGKGHYKQDAVVNIIMELYDATGTVISTLRLMQAFPSLVGGMALASPGEPGELQVTFAYDSVEENGV